MLPIVIYPLVKQIFHNAVKNNMKENFTQFKGYIKITKRRVPKWVKIFELIGLYDLAKKFGEVVSVDCYENVFCNPGRYSILDRMAGLNEGHLLYLALGNGTAEPSITDTKLANETFRKLITTKARDGLFVRTSTYLATDEANGTHTEIGLFGGSNATSTKDSGALFTHASINISKASNESLTIDYDIEALTT
jgi:hypothetical protein